MVTTRVFDRQDTNFYSSWNTEETSGIVKLIIPELGIVQMTVAKAEEVSAQLAMHADHARRAVLSEEQKKNQPKRRPRLGQTPEENPAKEWKIGDRCCVNSFGEWLDGEIVALVHDNTVAMVVRDGYVAEKPFLVRNLKAAREEE